MVLYTHRKITPGHPGRALNREDYLKKHIDAFFEKDAQAAWTFLSGAFQLKLEREIALRLS